MYLGANLETKKEKPKSVKAVNPWATAPRIMSVIFLLAVFFTFAILALANDIMALGNAPPLRLALAIMISGIFAVFYAVAGISLRHKFWKAFLPLLPLQILSMILLANVFPDIPRPAQTAPSQQE
jgi:hypothetical protein